MTKKGICSTIGEDKMCNIVQNEALVFRELKLAGERQLIIEQIGIFWAMLNLPLNYTRKKEEQSQESIWHQMVLLSVKAWKLYETFGDVTTPEIPCQSFLYRLWFCLSVSCHDLFDFVLTLNFAFQIETGINPASTSVGILQILEEKASSKLSKHDVSLGWHKVKY